MTQTNCLWIFFSVRQLHRDVSRHPHPVQLIQFQFRKVLKFDGEGLKEIRPEPKMQKHLVRLWQLFLISL